MAGITGLGTTFNLPNYVGELFNVSPEDTPFLSAIGGLTGGVAVNSTVFTWSSYDLRDAADDRQRLEGADAPTAEVLAAADAAVDADYAAMNAARKAYEADCGENDSEV